MTTALKGPLRNQFWKKKRPQPYWGGENSGNALEASNALNYRVWGIRAVLSREIPGNALRAFRGLSGISSGKSQLYWGYGPVRSARHLFLSLPFGGKSQVLGTWANVAEGATNLYTGRGSPFLVGWDTGARNSIYTMHSSQRDVR